MIKLRKFNLKLALMRSRPSGKNLQYQARTAQDSLPQRLFQISFLRRRQIVSEYDQLTFVLKQPIGYLLHLTATDKGTGMRKSTITRQTPNRH